MAPQADPKLDIRCTACGAAMVISLRRYRSGRGRYCTRACQFSYRTRLSRESAPQRLQDGLDRSGECWLWTGTRAPNGYGQISVENRHRYTHRLAYEQAIGPIPDGKSVLHHCDVRHCCRPDHLFLGTQLENMHDMAAKGRKSSKNGSKLSPGQVMEIRRRYSGGALQDALAAAFGISQAQVSNVVRGACWPQVAMIRAGAQQMPGFERT